MPEGRTEVASGPDRAAPGALPVLHPQTLQVVRSSAARLLQVEDEFIRELYAEMTGLIPGLAGNGRALCERTGRSLLWAAATDASPDRVADALRQVGASNWMDGLPEARYTDVAHALVRAVRNLSWDAESTSIGSAWVSFFLWAEHSLAAGARRAAADQTAARQAAAERVAARREAAQREAARAQDIAREPDHSHPRPGRDVNLEVVADLLDDEDEDADAGPGYGQIMLSMTHPRKRPKR
jgi:hemoglobin-like flavoprotein